MGKRIVLALLFWLMTSVAFAAVNITPPTLRNLPLFPGLGQLRPKPLSSIVPSMGISRLLTIWRKSKGSARKFSKNLGMELR